MTTHLSLFYCLSAIFYRALSAYVIHVPSHTLNFISVLYCVSGNWPRLFPESFSVFKVHLCLLTASKPTVPVPFELLLSLEGCKVLTLGHSWHILATLPLFS